MRRNLPLFLILILLSPTAASYADPIRILPLGDSITEGGRKVRPEFTYRLPLQQLLADAHYDTEFIGSMDHGLDADFKWPDVDGKPFQLRHEGHYGWKTAAVRDHLADWMKGYPHPPEIVLIHLGTNDQSAADKATSDAQKHEMFQKAITDPLADIINMLRDKNPRVVILVGHLNFNAGPALYIRGMVEQMARDLSTEQSPVLTVSAYTGWHENPKGPDPDTFDWAHPNPQGQAKMARAWFDAMKPYLDQLQVGNGKH